MLGKIIDAYAGLCRTCVPSCRWSVSARDGTSIGIIIGSPEVGKL